MDASQVSMQVCNRSTLTAGPGHELPLGALRTRGAEQLGGGRRWYCTGLWFEFSLQHDYDSTQAAATVGRRIVEYVSRVQLRIPGWPGNEMLLDASLRSIRERTIQILGKQPTADPADTVDSDQTNQTDRFVIYVPFARPGVAEPHDFAVPAVLMGQGDLSIDLVATPLTGLSLDDMDVIVTADLEALTPRKPTFWRFLERTPTNDSAFDIVTRPEAFAAMWLYLTGTQSSDDLEAMFEETRQIRLELGGTLVHDGRVTIRALVERMNARFKDAALNHSVTAPTIVPLLGYGLGGVKTTKLIDGSAAGRVESSAAWEPSSGNTAGATLRLVTEEILSAPAGSQAERNYARALGIRGPVAFKVQSATKRAVRDRVVAQRLPAKMRPLGSRGRYGF